jgi:NiFe hydrogenase small subunit HydA
MTKTLYWLHCGGCGGDSMTLLNVESPNLIELLELIDVNVLWHPSLSIESPLQHRQLVEAILCEEQSLDILCIEGAVIRGPGGTGMYDILENRPKKDLVAELAKRARFVLAVGTCASFGGVTAVGDVEATGLQFHHEEKGGFLGESFTTRSGLPVINLPGCPCHCDVLAGTVTALLSDVSLPLNEYHTPLQWYGLLVHQGCIRNEYYEYGVEEHDFGQRGCLFFHMGCRGPLTHGPCNKLLWNRRSSKTRVGVPCSGCTHPNFPQRHPAFQTRNIEDIPLDLPNGVDRAHYMAYKGIAAAAAPPRLKKRETRL